jgi:hypothetical protein
VRGHAGQRQPDKVVAPARERLAGGRVWHRRQLLVWTSRQFRRPESASPSRDFVQTYSPLTYWHSVVSLMGGPPPTVTPEPPPPPPPPPPLPPPLREWRSRCVEVAGMAAEFLHRDLHRRPGSGLGFGNPQASGRESSLSWRPRGGLGGPGRSAAG